MYEMEGPRSARCRHAGPVGGPTSPASRDDARSGPRTARPPRGGNALLNPDLHRPTGSRGPAPRHRHRQPGLPTGMARRCPDRSAPGPVHLGNGSPRCRRCAFPYGVLRLWSRFGVEHKVHLDDRSAALRGSGVAAGDGLWTLRRHLVDTCDGPARHGRPQRRTAVDGRRPQLVDVRRKPSAQMSQHPDEPSGAAGRGQPMGQARCPGPAPSAVARQAFGAWTDDPRGVRSPCRPYHPCHRRHPAWPVRPSPACRRRLPRW